MSLSPSTSVKQLTLFPLIMLMVGVVDNIRNLAAAALFGPQLIFFFLIAAGVFLIPTALVSANLVSRWPKEGGPKALALSGLWPSQGLGSFLAIWFQWINTLIWYPAFLAFMAASLTYYLAPNKF